MTVLETRAPWPARDGLRITGVRPIVTAPEGVPLVVVRVDTSEPGLYGLGCATFTQRFHAVAATVAQAARGDPPATALHHRA
jgi:mannonate dehydratase